MIFTIQVSTHFIVGIIIQYLVFNYLKIFPIWALIIITIVFGFLSHAILDPLAAKFTYHPPEANWHDIFWVSYHLGIYILTIVVIIFFIQYWIGMIASIIPDILDWGARALRKFKIFHLEWYNEPYVHNFIDRPMLNLMSGIKGNINKKSKVLFEIILDSLLLILAIIMVYF
ncbi:MAG: hypothetical protein ACTSQO_14485 [Candidatus Helarchaeota archaeon]